MSNIPTVPQEVETAINGKQFDPELRSRILAWDEPEFLAFLSRNSKKVASKLRSARNIEAQRDIGLELFVARILSITGCEVTYEPKPKGPDFLARYQGEQFFCEVTRLREVLPQPVDQMEIVTFPSGQHKKMRDIICEKFRQIEVGHPNVIYIRSNRFTMQKVDLTDAFTSLLKQLLSEKDDFFQRHGFKEHNEFKERAQHCSAIVFDDLWPNSDSAESTAKVYLNVGATQKLSEKLLTVLHEAVKIPFIKRITDSGA